MPDDSYLTDLLKRVVACDKEAMTGVKGFTAARYFPYTADTLPYMSNRLGPKSMRESPEDSFEYTRTILKRLVVAHTTEGFQGQTSDKLNDWLEAFEDYYRHNEMLTSATFTTEPEYLSPLGVTLANDDGLVFFSNNGIGVTQIGVEFRLQVPIIRGNF
jgi:hypothetical protein